MYYELLKAQQGEKFIGMGCVNFFWVIKLKASLREKIYGNWRDFVYACTMISKILLLQHKARTTIRYDSITDEQYIRKETNYLEWQESYYRRI
jgi:hypothetical protein